MFSKNTVLQLPKSICVLTTHQKHLCCHTYLTTTKKNNKNPNCKNPQNLTSYVWDVERSVPRDPFLCCLLSAMVQSVSVRTWHHIQKRNYPLLDLLLDPLTHPQVGGETPLAEVPYCLPLDKTSGVPAFNTLLLLVLSTIWCRGVCSCISGKRLMSLKRGPGK